MADNVLPPFWIFDDVRTMFDRWEADEHPTEQQRNAVLLWLADRMDNPYAGVWREPPAPNLWIGTIPGSQGAGGRIVVCSYTINEAERVLKCEILNSQRPPFVRSREDDCTAFDDADPDD